MSNGNAKSLMDYQEEWIVLINKWDSRGYDKLSDGEKIWFNVQTLLGAVANGGFISYYYNSGADTVYDCLAALKTIGADEAVSLTQKMNSLFGEEVPADVNDRNDIIDSWPDDSDEIDDFLEEVDEKYFSQRDYLETRLVAYIQEHNLVAS